MPALRPAKTAKGSLVSHESPLPEALLLPATLNETRTAKLKKAKAADMPCPLNRLPWMSAMLPRP